MYWSGRQSWCRIHAAQVAHPGSSTMLPIPCGESPITILPVRGGPTAWLPGCGPLVSSRPSVQGSYTECAHAPPQSRHFCFSASFHLNKMASHKKTPARDWSTCLLQAEVFIDWSTLRSVLWPWSGLSSQAAQEVKMGTCAGKENPSRRSINLPLSARPRLAST